MQKWEYLFVQTNSELNYVEPLVLAINGQNVLNKKLNSLEYIQQVGAEGWEMVGITLANNRFFVFKRPKP